MRRLMARTAVVAATLTFAACGAEESAESPPTTDTEADMADTAAADALQGVWTFEYVEDRPVVDRSPAHIVFDPEGQVSGSASCNRMTGSYTVDGSNLELSPLAVTGRMCIAESLMEQETRVLAALERVAGWRIEQGLLVLADPEGEQLFRASPRSDDTAPAPDTAG